MKVKFRIWDNQEQKFFEPIYDASNGNLQEILIGCSGDINVRRINQYGNIILEHESIYPNRFVKSMFTGLKDKNGKDIYCGDLYSCFENVYQIVFKNGAFCGGKQILSCAPMGWDINEEKDELIEGVFPSQIEIIGNIYQNKNLLKP